MDALERPACRITLTDEDYREIRGGVEAHHDIWYMDPGEAAHRIHVEATRSPQDPELERLAKALREMSRTARKELSWNEEIFRLGKGLNFWPRQANHETRRSDLTRLKDAWEARGTNWVSVGYLLGGETRLDAHFGTPFVVCQSVHGVISFTTLARWIDEGLCGGYGSSFLALRPSPCEHSDTKVVVRNHDGDDYMRGRNIKRRNDFCWDVVEK